MIRTSRLVTIGLAIGLAAIGAVIAYFLAGSRWAVLGGAIGAITGSFAPSTYDWLNERAADRDELRTVFEESPPRSLARLLDPRRELVGFIGREEELAKLMAWCGNDHAGRLRLVTGPGGVGKTRLAVELCDRTREIGWHAERIADGQEPQAITKLRAVTRQSALLVVDYAEAKTGLKQLLTALASERGINVRVLLLSRATGDWWDQLGIGEPAVWDQVEKARSARIELQPEVKAELSDQHVVALAVRAFARELGVREKTVELGGDVRRKRMLDLQAAALVAVLDSTPRSTVQVDISQVLNELLRHEQHFWYESARAFGLYDGQNGVTTEALRQTVAAGCLLGAISQAEATSLPGRVPGLSPSLKMGRWLRELYPPDRSQHDWIGSVHPDRLAELHAIRELKASPQFSRSCLANLHSTQALRALTLLARATADYRAEAEDLLRRVLPGTADAIGSMEASLEHLIMIFNAIPYPTVILAQAAVTLGKRILDLLPSNAEPTLRAYWLANLGMRFSALGRPAEALPLTEEAVAIRRDLTQAGPYRHRPDLARSLTNLGVLFSQLGRPADALPPTQEAVASYRDLAAANPHRYQPDLAASLSNLGVSFSELGRPADALAPTQEAVAAYRDLTAASPHRYQPDLARSLDNLGVLLSELGRPIDALPVTEEAVASYRDLAAASPDRYRPDLARSLTNLGVRFSELGRPAGALPPSLEAVASYRDLATANPHRYRPHLATSLDNLGIRFVALGRPADALPVTEEAVAIYRDLTAASPDRYRPDLARSLTNLGVRFSELGRPADALPPSLEAVASYRDLATANPHRYRPHLATSLDNLGIRFSELGRPADALPPGREAVTIYEDLTVANPDRYRPDLARSLTNLGVRFSALGLPADALLVTEQAVAAYRDLAASNSDRYRPDLAASLSNLGVRFSALGRRAGHVPGAPARSRRRPRAGHAGSPARSPPECR